MLFGNHDIIKEIDGLENIMREFYDEKRKIYYLFPHIEIDEGLILRYNETGDTIFLHMDIKVISLMITYGN